MLTTNEFLDALGGTSAAARLFGVKPAAVSNWRAAGSLPARLHHRAAAIAKTRGLNFDPAPDVTSSAGEAAA